MSLRQCQVTILTTDGEELTGSIQGKRINSPHPFKRITAPISLPGSPSAKVCIKSRILPTFPIIITQINENLLLFARLAALVKKSVTIMHQIPPPPPTSTRGALEGRRKESVPKKSTKYNYLIFQGLSNQSAIFLKSNLIHV